MIPEAFRDGTERRELNLILSTQSVKLSFLPDLSNFWSRLFELFILLLWILHLIFVFSFFVLFFPYLV